MNLIKEIIKCVIMAFCEIPHKIKSGFEKTLKDIEQWLYGG